MLLAERKFLHVVKCYISLMQSYQEFFLGKKITLMGLGLLGRGVGDAAFLAECGAQLTVTDTKTEAELAESIQRLTQYTNITFHLGGHLKDDFTSADMVIKAAGVPLDSPEIAAARDAGVQVMMSTALFAKFAIETGAIVFGVTGTRGKSTVAHMIHWAFSETADPATVHIGGNVRGISTLAMLPRIKKGDTIVLELDSWQLQGFGDLKTSPHVAVFTNLMPDHQNYYKNMDEYFADKANIFRYQKPGNALVVGESIREKILAADPPVAPLPFKSLPKDLVLEIPGEHNRENAALARMALSAHIEEPEIWASLRSFQGVEGRLQFVREVEGIKIYNDNNATTPEATIAALKALGFNITLIAGGSEKGLDLHALVSEIKKTVSHLIVLIHPNYKGSERLLGELQEANVPFEEAVSLQEAVNCSLEGKPKGPIIFSPAFASFGMFKNEYDRNDQFLRIINTL